MENKWFCWQFLPGFVILWAQLYSRKFISVPQYSFSEIMIKLGIAGRFTEQEVIIAFHDL